MTQKTGHRWATTITLPWTLCTMGLFLVLWPIVSALPPLEKPILNRDPRILLRMVLFTLPVLLPPLLFLRRLLVDRNGHVFSSTLLGTPIVSSVLSGASFALTSVGVGNMLLIVCSILIGCGMTLGLFTLQHIHLSESERERNWIITSLLAAVWGSITLFISDIWIREYTSGVLRDVLRSLSSGVPYTVITAAGLSIVLRSQGNQAKRYGDIDTSVARLLRIRNRLVREDQNHSDDTRRD